MIIRCAGGLETVNERLSSVYGCTNSSQSMVDRYSVRDRVFKFRVDYFSGKRSEFVERKNEEGQKGANEESSTQSHHRPPNILTHINSNDFDYEVSSIIGVSMYRIRQ